MFKRVVDVVQYLVLAGLVVFVIALFANEPNEGGGPASGPGAEVFAGNCAGCHGASGGGGVGPALGGGAVVEAYPDPADQIEVITNGRSGMPAFGGDLTPEEIEAVTDYTRNEL